MKPFLGIDITENKKNEHLNGNEFTVSIAPLAMTNALESTSEDGIELFKKAQLPLPIRIGHWICGAISVLIIIGLTNAILDEDGISLSQAYSNVPWLFWLGGICLLVWLVLAVVSRKKASSVMKSDESERVSSKLNALADSIYAELGVPADAADVDILSFTYKLKNGEPVAKEQGLNPNAYNNPEFKIFVSDGQLFLVDLEKKYSFPLSELRAIRTVKKNIAIPIWNKETPYNKGIYKQYKLGVDQFANIHVKPYHILELEHGGETWGIYFPNYELPTFETLTGLKAE
ncbi:MAG: hypothetical protein J1F23_02140 [Oscillospiraceae bacterium]|nr:hypothetical protein [Oscillospiraceae bacterium]